MANYDDVYGDHRGDGERHGLKRVLIVLSIVIVLSALVAGGTALWLDSSLNSIKRFSVTVDDESRPAPNTTDSLNILLLGADAGTERNGSGTSIIEDATKDTWPRGVYRSDATLLMHISADREKVYVASIPRDSYVPVHDATGQLRENTKINAALSIYGPSGALSTVENLADLRVDHLAMIDWDGFTAVTDALGGVRIPIAGQGAQTLNGDEALDYVRERKRLPNGDFDRVKRQQQYLRALGIKVIKRGIFTNPIELKKTLDAVTRNIAVDQGWSDGAIRSLTIGMRDLRVADIHFLTIPTHGTSRDPVAGSIVEIDPTGSEALFRAMRDDEMEAWVRENPDLILGKADRVR